MAEWMRCAHTSAKLCAVHRCSQAHLQSTYQRQGTLIDKLSNALIDQCLHALSNRFQKQIYSLPFLVFPLLQKRSELSYVIVMQLANFLYILFIY